LFSLHVVSLLFLKNGELKARASQKSITLTKDGMPQLIAVKTVDSSSSCETRLTRWTGDAKLSNKDLNPVRIFT